MKEKSVRVVAVIPSHILTTFDTMLAPTGFSRSAMIVHLIKQACNEGVKICTPVVQTISSPAPSGNLITLPSGEVVDESELDFEDVPDA